MRATNCAAAADPARSILGAAQEKWLFEQLATARARWTVLGQQVPSFARDNGPTAPPEPASRWTNGMATPPTRQRLFARLKETKAPNPIVLSGDVHVHLRRRPQARLRESRVGHRRRRVHQQLDHVGRRRQRGVGGLGADATPTTRTSSFTATGAATSPARRRRRRCAPNSRSSIASPFPIRRSERRRSARGRGRTARSDDGLGAS